MHFNLMLPWIAAAVGVALILLAAVIWSLRLRKAADQRLLRKIIDRHAEAVECDVTLSDGIDGFLFADYLLLLPGKIIVMKVMSKKGYIFGAGHIDEWTCVENNRTGKFRNPLVDVQLCAEQLRRALKFDAIEACVLFDRQSEFPKGVPDGVLRLAALDEAFAARHGSEATHEMARTTWDQLIALVHNDREELNQALEGKPSQAV